MRILTVSNVPLEAQLGSGYVVSGYVERLRALGHEVATLAPRDYELLPQWRRAKRLRVFAGYSRAVLRALRAVTYDLVELWGAESWWVAHRLSRRSRRPLIIGRSNGLEPLFNRALADAGLAPKRSPAARAFDGWQDTEAAFRRVDALTTVSLRDRDYALRENYQPTERLLALENPLADEWLDQPIADERPPVVSYFGSWLPWKGANVLPVVMTAVLRAQPGWRARLVGVGNLNPAETFPADVAARVEAIPFVAERPRLRRLYHETAIVLMPSVYESFGLVAAESMACGCALVASPTGFAAALRPGAEAVIVGSWAADAWSRAVLGLMAREDERRGIARAGHARVQVLRWAPAVARLLEFYDGLRRTQSAG